VRVGEDGLIDPNYTAMKTPRPLGAWAAIPVPPKRETPPPPHTSSSDGIIVIFGSIGRHALT
jgi:hypothetical protein